MKLKIGTALTAALLSATVGCKKGGGTSADLMELVPQEASIIATVNFDRMRGSKTWADINEFKNDPDAKKNYDEFVSKTGLDPLAQIHTIMIGMTPDASDKNQVGVVVKAQKLDEQKIVAFIKEKQTKKPLVSESYEGKTIYGSDDEYSLCFLDSETAIVAGKPWIKKMVDLSKGKGGSVKKNEQVQTLAKKTNTGEAIWGVGVVPPGTAPVPSGGEIKGISASADFANGFRAEVWAQAANNDDAKKLSDDLQKKIKDSKNDPQAAMMLAMSGLGSLIDSAKISSEGAWVHLTMAMSQQQVDELVNRMKGMAQMMKGMGGMGGMGMQPPPGGAAQAPAMPAPPPQAPPAAPPHKGKKSK